MTWFVLRRQTRVPRTPSVFGLEELNTFGALPGQCDSFGDFDVFWPRVLRVQRQLAWLVARRELERGADDPITKGGRNRGEQGRFDELRPTACFQDRARVSRSGVEPVPPGPEQAAAAKMDGMRHHLNAD
ncbi:MAG: hypothetical protein H6724_07300 [Sandaracinus sp.]|nr:hypothetical protein [Sandaracinus sp.]